MFNIKHFGFVPCVLGALTAVSANAQDNTQPIGEEELSLRHSISDSLVGVWEGTFRARNPQTDETAEFDYRLEYSWARADGYLVGEGGIIGENGQVQKWSHDVYSWDGQTGERYISFNGFGIPIVHTYSIEGLDPAEDTEESWSFVRTHTGRVGSLGILQQRVTVTKDGDSFHLHTENRDPAKNEDFWFAYEMILERSSRE